MGLDCIQKDKASLKMFYDEDPPAEEKEAREELLSKCSTANKLPCVKFGISGLNVESTPLNRVRPFNVFLQRAAGESRIP